jgi:Mg-chelatase subunit ChlD
MTASIDMEYLFADWVPGRTSDTFIKHRSSIHGKGGLQRKITNFRSKEDKLSQCLKLSKQRVRSMTHSGKTNVCLHPDESFTEGKTVYVSTDIFSDKSTTVADAMEVVLGLATHETAHVLYTDFQKKTKSGLHHSIVNIIEDERIERIVCDDFPGYAKDLEAMKSYYFDRKYNKKKPVASEPAQLLDCFFRFVRFPKYVDKKIAETYAEKLLAMKGILTPFPETFNEVYNAGEAICEIIGFSAEGKPRAGKGRCKELEDLVNVILDCTEKTTAETIAPDKALNDPMCRDMITGRTVKTGNNVCFSKPGIGNKAAYIASARKTKALSDQIRSFFAKGVTRDAQHVRFLDNGNLDDTLIADLVAGNRNVYMSTDSIDKSTLFFDIALLVDESGSMETKMTHAKDCAIMLSEAFSRIKGNQLFVFGFTSDFYKQGDTVIASYIEPASDHRHCLASMEAKQSNRDGLAIAEVGKRIRKFTQRPVVMFVISDGEPACSALSREDAIKETRESVEALHADGIQCVQVGIGTNPETQHKMFHDFVTFIDAKSLPRQLKKILVERSKKFRNKSLPLH